MLDITKKDMIRTDFEKFFKSLKVRVEGLSFEVFGSYSASVLNFYVSNGLIENTEKQLAGEYLVHLFNAGYGNRISLQDRTTITQLIIDNSDMDYTVIRAIFES